MPDESALYTALLLVSSVLGDIADFFYQRGSGFEGGGGLWDILAVVFYDVSILFSNGAQATLEAADASKELDLSILNILSGGIILDILFKFIPHIWDDYNGLLTWFKDFFSEFFFTNLASFWDGDNNIGFGHWAWANWLYNLFYDARLALGDLIDLNNMSWGIPWYGFSGFFQDPFQFIIDLFEYWHDYDFSFIRDPLGALTDSLLDDAEDLFFSIRDSLLAVLAKLLRYWLEGVWGE